MTELRNEGNLLTSSLGSSSYGLFCQLTNVDPSSEIHGAPNPSSSKSAEPPGAMKVVR